jgi:hypothetical protein
MLAATPRWATLPTLHPFHRGLYRRICACIVPSRGVNLSLRTSLATLPERPTLWSTHLEFPALGFCAFGMGFRCFFGFSTAASLSGVLPCMGVWFCCTRYIPSVGSSVHNISDTYVCSSRVGFDFCRSGNAIRRPCARSWNIDIWAFFFTAETRRSPAVRSVRVQVAPPTLATQPTQAYVGTGFFFPDVSNPSCRTPG